MNLLIIDKRDSWHVNDLNRAAGNQVAIVTATYDELTATFDRQNQHPTEFTIAGQNLKAFDAVLTRAMPASSLEQIVFRMDALNQIEHQLNIPVINPAKTIESSVDKYLSLELMRQHDLSIPETHVSQNAHEAMTFFEDRGRTVLKPIFGSQGRGVCLLDNPDDAMKQFNRLQAEQNVIYQQEFIEHGDSDIRVLVVGGQLFAMKRRNPGNWITNASQGGVCLPYQLTQSERELAITAAHSQNALVAGVDIIYDQEQAIVVEINANPSWKNMAAAIDDDVSEAVLYLIGRMAGYELSRPSRA